jgi:hypothetical protein
VSFFVVKFSFVHKGALKEIWSGVLSDVKRSKEREYSVTSSNTPTGNTDTSGSDSEGLFNTTSLFFLFFDYEFVFLFFYNCFLNE